MKALSKKKPPSIGGDLSFARAIADMSMRGDMDSVVESLRGYWRDRKSHPWHTLYNVIGKHSQTFENDQDLENTLMRIRDAVFGALELGSLSLALQISTDELLSIVLSGRNWADGRRKARASSAEMVSKNIEKGELDYLTAIGLEVDGMGYMLPSLKQAQLAQYHDAKPKEEDGKYDFRKLARSAHGPRALRAAGITQAQLDVKDPRVAQLMECYEHLLVELELDISTPMEFPQVTLQTTLNGDLVEEAPTQKVSEPHPKRVEKQQPLTEFIANEPKKPLTRKAKAPKKKSNKTTMSGTKTRIKAKRKETSSKK